MFWQRKFHINSRIVNHDCRKVILFTNSSFQILIRKHLIDNSMIRLLFSAFLFLLNLENTLYVLLYWSYKMPLLTLRKSMSIFSYDLLRHFHRSLLSFLVIGLTGNIAILLIWLLCVKSQRVLCYPSRYGWNSVLMFFYFPLNSALLLWSRFYASHLYYLIIWIY